ncbi:uncharacterized protein LOC113375333 [Ctenocephalides felis]|uniref:uncharacterized protein LOC113375333 n=1 Tax=Ctenocephalides felis TaxID=7515 RepID=UPI000E6E22AD|nr:uncharacterized protein LOC113375333 [Ctenocephalides felis]
MHRNNFSISEIFQYQCNNYGSVCNGLPHGFYCIGLPNTGINLIAPSMEMIYPNIATTHPIVDQQNDVNHANSGYNLTAATVGDYVFNKLTATEVDKQLDKLDEKTDVQPFPDKIAVLSL